MLFQVQFIILLMFFHFLQNYLINRKKLLNLIHLLSKFLYKLMAIIFNLLANSNQNLNFNIFLYLIMFRYVYYQV